ncbi:hypothetical protein PROFUN_15338 [Planoprotostelium fungivorum]|uniref:Uncharacterized protein n=1 Tax=Planoprotostelium fungivorum TaxID=1890364 RepID=A0A2P6MWW0_9EUKA|nr:hypothetical protein PROFUN_15338 [Planoprotostelium fungivorum]
MDVPFLPFEIVAIIVEYMAAPPSCDGIDPPTSKHALRQLATLCGVNRQICHLIRPRLYREVRIRTPQQLRQLHSALMHSLDLFDDKSHPGHLVHILSVSDLPNHSIDRSYDGLVRGDARRLLEILRVCPNIESFACSSTPLLALAIKYANLDHPDEEYHDCTPVEDERENEYDYHRTSRPLREIIQLKKGIEILEHPAQCLDLTMGSNKEFVMLTGGMRKTPLTAEYSVEEQNYPPDPRMRRMSLFAARSMPMPIVWGRDREGKLLIPTLSTEMTHFDLFEKVVNEQTQPDSMVALNLGMCFSLSARCLTDIFVKNPIGLRGLKQLNLWMYGSSIHRPNLSRVITQLITKSPIFTSGQLEWLDVSGADVSREDLQLFHPLPKLRSLGLSFSPRINFADVLDFLRMKAPNVEVIALVCSCEDRDHISEDHSHSVLSELFDQLLKRLEPVAPWEEDISCGVEKSAYRSKLRVVELSRTTIMQSSYPYPKCWTPVHGRTRSWVVDDSRMWKSRYGREESIPSYFARIGCEIGWHPRKMEVLRGEGFFGRDNGALGIEQFKEA